MTKLLLDDIELTEGKFYLYKVATQAGTMKDLMSVMFFTDEEKFYEVVFTRPGEGNVATGWYLVEREVKKAIPEAEIVEAPKETKKAKKTANEDSNTLSIQVEDELNLADMVG